MFCVFAPEAPRAKPIGTRAHELLRWSAWLRLRKSRGLAPYRDLAWFLMKYGGRSDPASWPDGTVAADIPTDNRARAAAELASDLEAMGPTSNRIALGLARAALIVGAAMLLRVPTTFTVFGYPGFAVLLFLAAAAGCVWLAFTILAGDVKVRHH